MPNPESNFDITRFAVERRKPIGYVEEEEPIQMPLPDHGEIIDLSMAGYHSMIVPVSREICNELLENEDLRNETFSTYDRIKTIPAEQNIRDRFDLSKDQKIFMSSGGSDELIQQLIYMYHLPPKRVKMVGITPHFPAPANYINALYPEDPTIEYSEGLTYGPIPIPLEADFTTALEIAKKRRLEDIKRARQENETYSPRQIPPEEETEMEQGVDEEVLGKIIPFIYYICNPGNPKGDVGTPEDIEDFVKFCDKNGDIVLIDEALGDVLPDKDSAIHLVKKYQNVGVLRTFSKIMELEGTGAAYAVLSDEISKHFEAQPRPHQIRSLNAYILNICSNKNVIREHLDRVLPQIIEDNIAFTNALDKSGIKYIRSDDRVPVLTIVGKDGLYSRARKQGIKTTKGSGYFKASVDDPKRGVEIINSNCIRIGTPTQKQLPIVINRLIAADAA